MKAIGTVQGSAEQAKPLVIGYDTVYVHTDIQPAVDETGTPIEGQYVYHEVQYDLREYLQLTEEQRLSAAADSDAMLVDHEYRLAMMELG